MTRKSPVLFAALMLMTLSAASRGTAAADPPALSAPGAPAAPALAQPAVGQVAPGVSQGPSAANQFERGTAIYSLPAVLRDQWSLETLVPPESLISERYLRTVDNTARRLTLKQVIYIAISNNPGVKAVALGPLGATESVRNAAGVFDPDALATLDQIKTVTPATTSLASGDTSLNTKNYDWNFTVNKLLATTNGTLSVTFNNNRIITNNSTLTVNPAYNSTLGLSLSQPLLRNFGWKFATINIQLAESGQKQAQWTMAQQLIDFVQRVGNDYWAVVQAEKNLEVQREALKFNRDLVRQNAISVRVGTMAPLDLQEAQSAEATAEANLYTAEAQLKTARVALREDVMLNPALTFLPQNIEPADQPDPSLTADEDEMKALQTAVLYRPSLATMREAIRTALLQVKFQENQILPQLNVTSQFAALGMRGVAGCGQAFGAASKNCFNPQLPGSAPNGVQLPFDGGYSTVLNKLFNFGFYNYAIALNYERQLANASARAALGQARVGYEHSRMEYRASLSQAVVEVENALANVHADVRRVAATKTATYYAHQALHDEQVRFRVGMATTHDLLQFQEQLVAAEGNEVQAEVDLENGWLALEHAKGTLLQVFNIQFQIEDPHETRWYTSF